MWNHSDYINGDFYYKSVEKNKRANAKKQVLNLKRAELGTNQNKNNTFYAMF